jgi:phospholipase/carboxylesterase
VTEVLPAVEIDARGEPRGTILWLHGLGASGHDFEPIVPHLGLPDVRFVFPHAPERGVTINGGLIMPAWYDILAMGRAGGEDADDVRESAALVEALIAREAERGVPPERVVLAGFSQGGAMALFVGARHPRPLRGIMVLSGYEVLAHTREAEQSAANRETPLLFCHGTYDPMVALARARDAFAAYGEGRAGAQWHQFSMGHEVSAAEIAIIREWLAARFARD